MADVKSTTCVTQDPAYTPRTPTGIGPRMDYIKSLPGILKIVEIVFSIIPVICVSVEWFPGDGWVWFVCITGFFNVLIWFILYFLGIYERLPWRHVLVIFVCYCVFSVFYLIAGIVSAAAAGKYPAYHAIGATAFFTFAATAAFAFDTYLQYGSWRKAQFEMGSAYSATVTTTTTTTTQVEHFETY